MPSTTFADLGVPADLVGTLHARGLVDAFAIQAMTIPDGLAGRDLCGRAPDRLGQDHRLRHPARRTRRQGAPEAARAASCSSRPASSPRRSAASSSGSAGARKLRVAAVYGGAGFGAQLKALRRGVDVLVACPGRLTDLIERREVDLDEVEIVVVDEADRMADMGFLPAVQQLLDRTPADPPDAAVLGHARRRGRPARAALPARPVAPRAARGRPDARATHRFWTVDRGDRVDVTAEIVARRRPDDRVLPHQARRRRAGEEARAARRAQRGDPRQPLAGPARARARGVRRRQGRTRSSPPTSRRAASTSTTSPASCTSTRRPTSRTTRTARAAPRAPAPNGTVVSLVVAPTSASGGAVPARARASVPASSVPT